MDKSQFTHAMWTYFVDFRFKIVPIKHFIRYATPSFENLSNFIRCFRVIHHKYSSSVWFFFIVKLLLFTFFSDVWQFDFHSFCSLTTAIEVYHALNQEKMNKESWILLLEWKKMKRTRTMLNRTNLHVNNYHLFQTISSSLKHCLSIECFYSM